MYRQGHAACLVENLPQPYGWGFVVYGGYLANRQIANDVYVLSERNKLGCSRLEYKWTRYEMRGWINIRTYGHSLTRVQSVSKDMVDVWEGKVVMCGWFGRGH